MGGSVMFVIPAINIGPAIRLDPDGSTVAAVHVNPSIERRVLGITDHDIAERTVLKSGAPPLPCPQLRCRGGSVGPKPEEFLDVPQIPTGASQAGAAPDSPGLRPFAYHEPRQGSLW